MTAWAREGAPEVVRVVHYNLRNWLTQERDRNGERLEKPEAEKAEAVSLLVKAAPDVLSVCEIGTEEDVADLKRRLRERGVELPHHVRHGGADTTRFLAVLSRFPLVKHPSPAAEPYWAGEVELAFQRGVLDVEVEVAPDYRLRLLSTHLKSRREVLEADQALMRRNEALLLRQHVERVLAESPEVNLLLTGDFNETKNSQTIRLIQGGVGDATRLRDLRLEDKDGHRFTYYWPVADTYERIDFAFVNDGLWPEIDLKRSELISSPTWTKASDHRPLLITLIPRETAKRRR